MAPYVPRTKAPAPSSATRLMLKAKIALRQAHPQIDRIRRMCAAGQDFDRRRRPAQAAHSETPEIRVMAASASTNDCGNQLRPKRLTSGIRKAPPRPTMKIFERMKDAAHHFDSVKASIESVFFDS